MSTSPARKARRLSEREKSRRARQSSAAKSPPSDAGAAAAAGDADSLAAAAAAMAAANPEAAGAAAATASAAPNGSAPPLTMDQIPEDARKALGPLLARANGEQSAEDAAAEAERNKKRAKKFIALEKELAGLLTSPSIPAYMAGDEFCGEHFAVEGPIVAQQLTMLSEAYPSTYDTLHWLAKQGILLMVLPTLVRFIARPAGHHGLPMPDAARRHYGIPPRHTHPLAAVA